MEQVVPASFGQTVKTHMGRPYRVLKPGLADLVKNVKRQTQIIYPKDIAYIVMRLSVGPGAVVVEAGSGSGSLTLALAWYVGPEGRVYTHERREEFRRLNQRNLEWAGFNDGRVVHLDRDIAEGFGCPPQSADALFLDVRTPQDYVARIPEAIKPGSPVGFLVPTANQVSDLLRAFEGQPFGEVEVVELMLRRYKPVADRLRPEDRMVAHTGFLIFCRHGAQEPQAEAGPVEDSLGVETGGAGSAAVAADGPRGEDAEAHWQRQAYDDDNPPRNEDSGDQDSCEC